MGKLLKKYLILLIWGDFEETFDKIYFVALYLYSKFNTHIYDNSIH